MCKLDKVVLVAIASCALGIMLTGCAVPALLGVKTYQSGDTRVEFITGVDFGFGMNGVDNVNNNRGISPEGGISSSKAKPQQAKY